MTVARIAAQVRRIQLDLAWTVQRLDEHHKAMQQEIAESIHRIESSLPDGWRDRCSTNDLLVIEEAKEAVRNSRGPLDESIRDAERVLHVVDDLDRELLSCA